MTEQRQERQSNLNETKQPTVLKKDRNLTGAAGILGVAIIGASLILSGGGNESKPTNNAGATSGPTANEMATPKTSEAAGSASPESSSSPEINIQNFTVEKLGTFDAMPGDIIAGDISMSDTADSAIFPLYDQDTHKAAGVTDNTKTALYVEVQVPGVVHAEWGATVTRGLTAEKKAEMLKLQAISKERAGFDKVDVVIWTGYDTTVDEAGFKATGDQTSSINTVSPTESQAPTVDNLANLSNQDKLAVILRIFAEGKVDPDSEEGKVLMSVIVSCLCSCGTPEAPKPTPTPTPKVCTVPSFKDHVMKAGETYKVPAGVDWIGQGDIVVDGQKTYDSSDKTGAINVVIDQKANTIKAPWGADIQVFDCATDQYVKDVYNHDLEQLKATNRSLDKNSINQLK